MAGVVGSRRKPKGSAVTGGFRNVQLRAHGLRRTEDLNSDPQDHRREIRAEESQSRKIGPANESAQEKSRHSETQSDQSEDRAAAARRQEAAVGACHENPEVAGRR
jgi:hypothetical protein